MQNTQTYNPGLSSTYFGQVMAFFGFAILSSAIGTYVGFEYALPYIVQHPWVMFAIFGAELILIFTSNTWKNSEAAKPLFALFTFLSGMTLAPLIAQVSAEFGGAIIYKALAATAMTFVAAAIFAFRTEKNLMGMRGFLFTALIGMVVVGIIGIFVPWSNTFEMIFSGFGVILFAGYTMYDFQKIKYQSGMHPIDAALQIYLDIFNLFIFILRLMTSSRR